MLRAFDHICMEKARYKFVIIVIVIVVIIVIVIVIFHLRRRLFGV